MSCTFIAKRYNLHQRAYVDSKNVKIEVSERFPAWLGDPSDPPVEGSAPILSLPTELRLHIYSYLTNRGNDYVTEIQTPFGIIPNSPSQFTDYAYLYRSPGRVTKPRSISKQVIDLFHICRVMREELIDTCFSDRTFVLEASFYKRDTGGLFVLPLNPGPSAWVKKLVILTLVEGNGFAKGIADLRPLQQMINLKELCIAFSVKDVKRQGTKIDALGRRDNVLKAILECVPEDTKVRFEYDNGSNREIFAQFRNMETLNGLYEMYDDQRENAKAVLDDLSRWEHRKGKLSGSLINHSLCKYNGCQEGLGCVQSHCKVLIKETKLVTDPIFWSSNSSSASSEEEDGKDETVPATRICDSSPTPYGPRKKCVHGFTRCDTCEAGFMKKLKCWTGNVYKY
jgi:hypothetical protein